LSFGVKDRIGATKALKVIIGLSEQVPDVEVCKRSLRILGVLQTLYCDFGGAVETYHRLVRTFLLSG